MIRLGLWLISSWKWIVGIVIAVTIVVLIIMGLVMPVEGTVESVRLLPRYSECFPEDSNLGTIKYLYEPWTGNLYLVGEASTEQMIALCKKWQLVTIGYGSEDFPEVYDMPRAPFAPAQNQFTWHSTKSLASAERRSILFYYQPYEPDNNHTRGKFYIHFWW